MSIIAISLALVAPLMPNYGFSLEIIVFIGFIL